MCLNCEGPLMNSFFFPNKYIRKFVEDLWQLEKNSQMKLCSLETSKKKLRKKLGMSWMHKTYQDTSLFYYLLP